MEKNERNKDGGYIGFDISSIDSDFSMILPGSGEPAKDVPGKEDQKVDKPSGTKSPFGIDLNQKIAIPETEEEAKELGLGVIKSGSEDDDTGEKDKSADDDDEGKENQDGGEDPLITEDSPLYLHAATIHEEGLLPTLDLESLKGKKLSEAFSLILEKQKEYIEEGREAYKNGLSDRQREFLDMIEKGIPDEYVEDQFRIEESYSKITDQVLADDADLQEQIIVQSLKIKGLSEKQINLNITAAKDKEMLFEMAKDAKEDIDAFIAKRKQDMIKQADDAEKEAVRKEAELQEKVKTTINGFTEIFPGVKISAKEKTELIDLMTKPVDIKVVNGKKVPVNFIQKERETDPIGFNARLIYYIKKGLFKKDFDASTISKKITSTNATKLFEKLAGTSNSPQGGVQIPEKKKEKPGKIIFPSFG